MAYDWTGERTRKIHRIKITLSVMAALAAIAVPVLVFPIR